MIFIISDFVNVDESYRKNLELLSVLFETVAIIVRDPLDNFLPDVSGEVVISNPGTGERMAINPKLARGNYEINAKQQLDSVKQIFKDSNIDFLELSTDKTFTLGFVDFLKTRIVGGRVVKIKNVR